MRRSYLLLLLLLLSLSACHPTPSESDSSLEESRHDESGHVESEGDPAYILFRYSDTSTASSLPEGTDLEHCQPRHLYALHKETKAVTPLLDVPVRFYAATNLSVFAVTEDNRLLKTDYQGTNVQFVYRAGSGAITSCTLFQNTIYLLDGHRVITCDTERLTSRAIAECPDLTDFSFESDRIFFWENSRGERFIHNIPNNYDYLVSVDAADWKTLKNPVLSYPDWITEDQQPPRERLNIPFSQPRNVNYYPFIYPSVPVESFDEQIGPNQCQSGYLYIQHKETKIITQLLDVPVKTFATTYTAIYALTQDGRLMMTDYQGSFSQELYRPHYGTLHDMAAYYETMYLLDGDYVIAYDTEKLTFQRIAHLPENTGNIFAVDKNMFCWEHDVDHGFFHSVSNNCDSPLAYEGRDALYPDWMRDGSQPQKEYLNIPFIASVNADYSPFIYPSEPAASFINEEIGPNECKANYLYVQRKDSKAITQLLDVPVTHFITTSTAIYALTQDNRLMMTDYQGTFTKEIYRAHCGTLSQMALYFDTLYVADGDYIIAYDIEWGTYKEVAFLPDLADDSLLIWTRDKNVFRWANNSGDKFVHNIPNNFDYSYSEEDVYDVFPDWILEEARS